MKKDKTYTEDYLDSLTQREEFLLKYGPGGILPSERGTRKEIEYLDNYHRFNSLVRGLEKAEEQDKREEKEIREEIFRINREARREEERERLNDSFSRKRELEDEIRDKLIRGNSFYFNRGRDDFDDD